MNPLQNFLSLTPMQRESLRLLHSCASSLSHYNAAEGEMWGLEAAQRTAMRLNYEQAREFCAGLDIPKEVMDAVMEGQLV